MTDLERLATRVAILEGWLAQSQRQCVTEQVENAGLRKRIAELEEKYEQKPALKAVSEPA